VAVRGHDRFAVSLCRFADFAHHQGLDFGPLAMQQRHEGAIDTQEEFVRCILDLGPVALDPFDFGHLHCFIGQTNRFGQPLGA